MLVIPLKSRLLSKDNAASPETKYQELAYRANSRAPLVPGGVVLAMGQLCLVAVWISTHCPLPIELLVLLR